MLYVGSTVPWAAVLEQIQGEGEDTLTLESSLCCLSEDAGRAAVSVLLPRQSRSNEVSLPTLTRRWTAVCKPAQILPACLSQVLLNSNE